MLREKIILRLATDEDETSCGGSGSNFERTEFWINENLYDRLQQNGAVLGSRYDSGGSKIDIINYEIRQDWYGFLMKDLGLI